MRLKDLLVTLPLNARLEVRIPGDECPVNRGAVSSFLAVRECNSLIVESVLPVSGETIITCRQPKRHPIRHIQILTPNRAKVVPMPRAIHGRRLRRHAPIRIYGPLSAGQCELVSDKWRIMAWDARHEEPEFDPDTDIYRQILAHGGIRAPRKAGCREEYLINVPLGIRRTNGLDMDEMADELGLSVAEMLEMLAARNFKYRNTAKEQKGRRRKVA